MKRISIVVTAFMAISAGSVCYAQSVHYTSYTTERSAIAADGDLAEWSVLNLQAVPLSFHQTTISKSQIAPAPNDLSASFMCFADRDYLYAAVSVKDDKVIIGSHPFGDGYRDDCVEICFDGDLVDTAKSYFDTNDGQLRIVPNPSGGAYIEGNVPYISVSIPYYWEARGIRCGYKPTAEGYNVEIAIPLVILEKDAIGSNTVIGLNVRVIDEDEEINEENADVSDNLASWSVDPEVTSWWKTETYNQVVFSTGIILDSSLKLDTGTVTSTSDNSWEISIGLDAPDAKAYNTELTAALNDISVGNWAAAEEKILPLTDRLWAQLFLGAIQLHSDSYTAGIQRLKDVSGVCKDIYAANWASIFPYDLAKVLMMTPARKKEHARAALLMHECLLANPVDERAGELMAYALKGTAGSPEDLKAISAIIGAPVNTTVSDQAQAALARYYYLNEQYENATTICNALIAKEASPTVALEAKMILLSMGISN